MAIYDVYSGPAFTFNRAYRRDSLHYKIVYYLIVRQGYRHIATCEADSKKDALRKVDSRKHDTKPIPYKPFSLESLFPKKGKILSSEYAEVMAEDREKLEAAVEAFVLVNFGACSEHRKQQTVIFTYLVEWLSLHLSKATRADVQRLMAEFTGLTHVFSSDDIDARMRSVHELQAAIKRTNSSELFAKTIKRRDLVIYLVFEFFIQANMEHLFRSSETSELIEFVQDRVNFNIARNNHFLSNFEVII